MTHKPYIREVPGSRSAVLLIHGILGTPNHFHALLPLIPEDWSVYNILLDGHGGGVEDFSRTSMKKWKAQVSAQLDALLEKYHRIILVGHSMGTLFSIQEAVNHPGKIDRLFLLQVPLCPRLTVKAAACSVLLAFGIVPKSAEMMMMDCGVRLEPWLWKYIGWLPRFLELFRECHATAKLLEQLHVPCQAFQSAHDEMVSPRAVKILGRHPHIRTTVLPNSGHFGHTGADLALLKQAFSQLFL